MNTINSMYLRGDKSSNIRVGDYILPTNEMLLETDTLKFKVGNGANRVRELPYLPFSSITADDISRWNLGTDISGKQDLLVSTVNIKSINGSSILGSGDLVVSGAMVYPSIGIAVSTGSGWDTSITDNSADWNTAYGWGNHASAGYITASSTNTLTNKSGNISQWTNDSGYLTTTGITPAALTKTDDTNVTLTLGGTPATSLLQAVSLTLGWTGTLADGRIASASVWNAKQNAITLGTTLEYFKGDLSLGTFPTALSSFTNDGVFITASSTEALTNKSGNISMWTNDSNYTTLAAVGAAYQPLDSDLTIIAGLTATTDNFIVSVSSAWASRTPAQVKTTLSLNNVENTALSTWAGSANITTLGTISTGTVPVANVSGLGTAATTAATDYLSSSTSSTQDGYFGDIYLYDDTSPSHYLKITNAQNLTATKVLSLICAADATLTIATGSISGTNTGDQDLSSYLTSATAASTYVPLTRTINGYDLSANRTLTTADVADSTNKRYVTDAQLTVIGNTSGTNTGDQTTISGNAGTATALQTARTINGTSFDGTANITVTAAAGTLTGTTLNATVVTSSLTAIGTIATGVWQGTVIDSTYGGTGVNNGGRTLTLNTNSGTLAFSAASKTLTIAKTLTLDGTDSTTMTFPTTSATIARTDAANTFTGASTASAWVLTSPTITTGIEPTSSDGAALGTSSKMFSDLFLASGGVINFNNGNATLTHSTGALAFNSVPVTIPVKATTASTSNTVTFTSSHYGNMFLWSPSGTATATLPANGATAGSWIWVFILTNQTTTISAATADTLITVNDTAADSVAFSTASAKIGSSVFFVSNGSFWIALNMGTTTMTIAT